MDGYVGLYIFAKNGETHPKAKACMSKEYGIVVDFMCECRSKPPERHETKNPGMNEKKVGLLVIQKKRINPDCVHATTRASPSLVVRNSSTCSSTLDNK